MNLEEIKAMDAEYCMATYARYEVAPVKGKGAVAVDGMGREYIDFGSGIGVNSLGFADEGWVNAISKQAGTLQHLSNYYYSETALSLCKELCLATSMDKAFLCNSGAEANECAVKIARKYSLLKYGEGRHTIITLNNSFHGRTITTLSATGQPDMHRFFSPFTEGFRYVTPGDIVELRKAMDDTVCAVMIEPVQGEGGVVPLKHDYVKQLAEMAAEKDVLLIADEVQTGMGRTGKMLASQHYKVRPDIVTLAKGLGGGLPIGACLAAMSCSDVLAPGDHGSTFGGNPVAAAGALYVLERISQPGFLAEVRKKGEFLKEQIKPMPGVESVWGEGLMIGIKLRESVARETAEQCLTGGLLVLTAKEHLRLLPPLNITEEEIGRGLIILESVLSAE